MTTLRRLVCVSLMSVKPISVMLAGLSALAIVLIAVVVFTALFTGDPERRRTALKVLQTLFGRSREERHRGKP